MNYYYLDGIDRKGPLSQKELKLLNLNPNTLIFQDGSTEWKPLKDIIESINEIDEKEILEEEKHDVIGNDLRQELNDQQNSKKEINIKIPFILFLGVGIVILFGLSYLAANIEKKYYKSQFDSEIDKYFKGSNYICRLTEFYDFDAIKKTISRESITVPTNSYILKKFGVDLSGKYDKGLCVDHKTLFMTPEKPEKKNYKIDEEYIKALDNYSFALKNWNKLINYKYYSIKCKNELLSIYKVKNKNPCDFQYIVRNFKDILVKTDLDLDIEHLKNIYYKSLMFETNQTDEDSINFEEFSFISNKYYFLKQDGDSWKYSTHHDKPIYIENSLCIIWYDYDNYQYKITEKNNMFIKYWIIYSLISSLIFLSTLFLIKHKGKYKFAFSIKNH